MVYVNEAFIITVYVASSGRMITQQWNEWKEADWPNLRVYLACDYSDWEKTVYTSG
jgi:hypothetical protein